MNIDQFEKKYSHYGGIKQLVKMRNSLSPLNIIANHFKVSRERVRQWMIELFGSKYDPRKERREVAIGKMINFYFSNTIEKFNKKYKNTAYYKDSLKAIKKIII